MSFSFALVADVQHADKVQEYALRCIHSDNRLRLIALLAGIARPLPPPAPVGTIALRTWLYRAPMDDLRLQQDDTHVEGRTQYLRSAAPKLAAAVDDWLERKDQLTFVLTLGVRLQQSDLLHAARMKPLACECRFMQRREACGTCAGHY